MFLFIDSPQKFFGFLKVSMVLLKSKVLCNFNDMAEKYRCILEIPEENGTKSLFCKSTIPKINIDPIEVPYLATSTWNAGRYNWNNIEVFFLDWTDELAYFNNWLRIYCEESTGRVGCRVGYSTFHKKNMILKQVDPTGVIVSKWNLIGTQIVALQSENKYDYEYDKIILNRKFSIRRVLFEKQGNPSFIFCGKAEIMMDRVIMQEP